MSKTYKSTVLLGLLAVSCQVAFAQDGRITELFQADFGTGVPNAIEVFDLANLHQADLVIINTGFYRHGQVLPIVTLTAPAQVLLVGDAPWPDESWDGSDPPPGSVMVASDLPGGAFDFAGPRSILLFDRKTSLNADRNNLFTNPIQQQRLAGATLLDWLTFAPGGQAATLDSVNLGSIISGPTADITRRRG
jgi:hypothetical protein